MWLCCSEPHVGTSFRPPLLGGAWSRLPWAGNPAGPAVWAAGAPSGRSQEKNHTETISCPCEEASALCSQPFSAGKAAPRLLVGTGGLGGFPSQTAHREYLTRPSAGAQCLGVMRNGRADPKQAQTQHRRHP